MQYACELFQSVLGAIGEFLGAMCWKVILETWESSARNEKAVKRGCMLYDSCSGLVGRRTRIIYYDKLGATFRWLLDRITRVDVVFRSKGISVGMGKFFCGAHTSYGAYSSIRDRPFP